MGHPLVLAVVDDSAKSGEIGEGASIRTIIMSAIVFQLQGMYGRDLTVPWVDRYSPDF